MANERQTVMSLSARSENVARQASLQADQIQRTERAEAAAARLAGELEDVKQRLIERTRDLRMADRRLAEARRAGLSDKLRLRDLHARESLIAELQARCEILERELAGIAASTSWKVTAPVRWVGIKYPALARAMRRSLKLAWWALRFELMSRLREALRRRSRT